MKLEPKYRYVAWDMDGQGFSYDEIPVKNIIGWINRYGTLYTWEHSLSGGIHGEDALTQFYDMEYENDRLLVQALMEL